jgi:transcriptional regulator with XRE-family HTH domain
MMIDFLFVGEAIKKRRNEIGLKQEELVEQLLKRSMKISRETLSKMETGKRTISAIELKVIADVLSMDLNDLYQQNDQEYDLLTLCRQNGCEETNPDDIKQIQECIVSFINQKSIDKKIERAKRKKVVWRF